MNDTIDTRDITKDGITYRVTVSYDPDATPYDADCYDASDIAAWKANYWHYVIVDVTPVIDGTEVFDARVSLGGTDFGTLGDGKVIDMDNICDSHPVPDLITEARGLLVDALPRMISSLSQVRDQL